MPSQRRWRQRLFDDTETDTLYFLSDGLPTSTLSISNADDASYENDYKTAAPCYSSQNKNRIKPLIVNATSVKLMSDWMKIQSEQTSGNYLQSQ